MSSKGFRITDGKGFGITFANGWTISVQFGWGNYCDNYDRIPAHYDKGDENRRCGEDGSQTAECAAINPKGDMVDLPAFMSDGDPYTVSNRSTTAQVLQLMNWVAEQQP